MATPKKNNPQKAGRKSLYKKEYCRSVEMLCKLGATDKELAEFFEVSEVTLNAWKKQFPQFLKSIKAGKLYADANVVESLYQRALGYKHDDVDIKVVKGKIVKTKLVKHYPPDSTAMIFWLKNRRKVEWRDKQDLEVTGKNGAPLYKVYKGIDHDKV
jgi:hypothetical protein